MIIVDTNVVSENMRAEASPAVLNWFSDKDPAALFTTAVTRAEVELGVERLRAGRRKDRLRMLAGSAFDAFDDRVLPFEREAARRYAWVVSSRQGQGRPIGVLDAQIAAICVSRGAVLATRNVKDFDGLGIELVNPWDFGGS